MSRLTEQRRNFDGTAISKESLVREYGMLKGTPSNHCIAILNKLADYEDKEEQGLLIELPSPIGSVMYEISIGEVQAVSITGYEIDANGIWVCFTQSKDGTDCTANLQIIELFKTRSEAEEALAKMGGK